MLGFFLILIVKVKSNHHWNIYYGTKEYFAINLLYYK